MPFAVKSFYRKAVTQRKIICLDAAAIKAKHSLSYADAFAAELTISKKAVLITGDDEFDSLKEPGFKVKYIV